MRQPHPGNKDETYQYESEMVVALVRMLVVVLALLSPQMLPNVPYDVLDLSFLLPCAAVLIFNAAIGYAAYRRFRLPLIRRPGMIVIDLALVTLWMSSSGTEKPLFDLFPLYYLTTIVAAIWFGVSGALLTAGLSTLFYAMVKLTAHFDVAQAFQEGLGIQVSFLFLVALLSGSLAQAQEAERRRRAEEQLILSNLKQQVEISQDIQSLLIPQELPSVQGLDIGARQRPSVQAGGGDYYDLLALGEGKVAICIADVSGKSLRAQSRLPMLKHAWRALVANRLPPEQVVAQLNTQLYDDLRSDLFITLCYAVCDVQERRLTLCNAGHLPPLLLSSNGHSQWLATQGSSLGFFRPTHPHYQPYQSQSWKLAPEDTLVFYTDGVTDTRNPQGEEFGEERLRELVTDQRDQSAQDIANVVVRAVSMFERLRNLDDVAVVVVKMLPD
jgi:serine phosphatase RsbU (regulator of sigma subunit)